MAGPGGGPPRKSHTKSRKGCKTCKRRHIRCDETFPQCRNCTKHNCRCDYMDQPASANSVESPAADMLLDSQVVDELRAWRTTGQAPFPELEPPSEEYWNSFSMLDQRLLQHIAALSQDLHTRGYSRFTVWANRLPLFLTVARSNDFVMSAVLAFSASHLAWVSGNSETQNLAYHHHGIALKGLHEAIGRFSKDTSEAILAASILLSWQATEWRGWASLQQGVSTVLGEMQPWLHETELGTFLQEQRASRGARTPVIPPIPLVHRTSVEHDLTQLDAALSHLQQLRQRVHADEDLVGRVDELFAFVAELRRDFPIQAPEQAFERLQKLRMWLFWLPPALLRQETDLGSMAVLAHFFSTALLIEPLFPEIGGSYFGSMVAEPIDEIRTSLLRRQASEPQERALQVALSLTEFPHHIVMAYRSRQQYARHAGLYTQQSQQFPTSHRSSYSDNFSAYPQDSLNSPSASLTVPIPSPCVLPGRISRPSSHTSQPSVSPTFDPNTGHPFVHGTPVSMPGELSHPDSSASYWDNSPRNPNQHLYFGQIITPNELWI